MVDNDSNNNGTALPVAKALPESPTDGITCLSYLFSNHNNKNLLASTSWDGSVRIHDTKAAGLMLVQSMGTGPLLSMCCSSSGSTSQDNGSSNNNVVTGSIDGSIQMLDVETGKVSLIGHQQQPQPPSDNSNTTACSCLSYAGEHIVASAGWNQRLLLWDTRCSSATTTTPATAIDLPGKAFSMDVDHHQSLLAIACSGRRMCFVDLRYGSGDASSSTSTPTLALDRESSLKYQTRCVRFFPDGNAIAVGSIEGRAAVEYLEELGRPLAGKKFAFKCHRAGDRVYPVNAIDFHPVYGTFATGGCDGTVVTWDGINKKKITALPAFPSSIAALAFNHDGSELAIASSYTFEEGEREHPKDEIFIRPMLDTECRPKSKS